MKIIAGSLRGRVIKSGRKESSCRPISGRIKQSLFDILTPKVVGARFLDLYAGTGAVGIEAMSRGADFAFFIERDKFRVQRISEVLKELGLAAGGRVRVFKGDALNDLSWVSFRAGVGEYDLIFMGPPYKDSEKRSLAYSDPTLQQVARSGLLAPGGWAVCQHHLKEDVAGPEAFEMFRRERYGDSYLSFFRRRET